jgi:DeoR/GlpR family transcriptional regulator of sugar metabolism
MKHIPRHEEILKIITRLRSISVQDLTYRLKVSEVTIRKDLNTLEEMGFILRSHGKASLAEDSRALRTLSTRKTINTDEKKRIARRASSLIKEGDTIYIDTGSTCRYLAESIGDISIRVITNSLDVMNVLSEEPGISLVSLGGNYRKEAGSFLGPLPIETLKNFQIETCFLGATGVLSRGIFSSQNILESQLKQQVLEVSGRRVVMADSNKFGHSAFSVFARSSDIDILITDTGFKESENMVRQGLEIILA